MSVSCQTATSNVQVAQTKSRPKAALNLILMIGYQAAINAGFDFRRYAMKPMPAKPRSSIAHVEGSGTAEPTVAISTFPLSPMGGLAPALGFTRIESADGCPSQLPDAPFRHR
jgi:hypothetical protein